MSNKKEVLFLREEYGEGHGKYTYPHGDKYEGEWKNGEFHGQGTYTSPDGSKYEGEYKNGEIWNGTYYDSDGDIIGKFVNGKRIKQ